MPDDGTVPPTLSSNIGYLTDERRYLSWSFPTEQPYQEVVADLVDVLARCGDPFMRSLSTFEAILAALVNSKRGTPPDPADYRIVAGYLLTGETASSRAYVTERVRMIGNREDSAADLFKRFVIAMKVLTEQEVAAASGADVLSRNDLPKRR
jgi:hypothetical protein